MLNVTAWTLQETGGEYGIALNERHFEELVFSHARPPPSLDSEKHASLVSLQHDSNPRGRMMRWAMLGLVWAVPHCCVSAVKEAAAQQSWTINLIVGVRR